MKNWFWFWQEQAWDFGEINKLLKATVSSTENEAYDFSGVRPVQTCNDSMILISLLLSAMEVNWKYCLGFPDSC